MKRFLFCVLLGLSTLMTACADDSSDSDSSTDRSASAAYKDALINTDFYDKDVALIVQSSGSWKVWRCESAEICDTDVAPAIESAGAGVFKIPGETDVTSRRYYMFENEHGRAMMADRFLPLEKLYNARDLGGITGADGRQIKYGKIVRSEAMGNIIGSDYDDAFLSGMNTTYVVDFRMDSEKATIAAHKPSSVPEGNLKEMQIYPLLAAPTSYGDAMYRDMYRTILLDPNSGGQAAYKELFSALMADEGLVIYHCTSGKDRAGLASALILTALGASEADVYEDYMATSKVAGGNPADVRPVWLMSGLAAVKAEHGSLENYIVDVLGVDIEALRAKYLY